jgi:hypothetical protein
MLGTDENRFQQVRGDLHKGFGFMVLWFDGYVRGQAY